MGSAFNQDGRLIVAVRDCRIVVELAGVNRTLSVEAAMEAVLKLQAAINAVLAV